MALEQPCKPTVIFWTRPLVLVVKPSTVALPLHWFASNTQGHCTWAAGNAQTHLFPCCFFQQCSSAVVLSNCRWLLLFPVLALINYVFKVTFGVPAIYAYIALAGDLTCDWIFLSAFPNIASLLPSVLRSLSFPACSRPESLQKKYLYLRCLAERA